MSQPVDHTANSQPPSISLQPIVELVPPSQLTEGPLSLPPPQWSQEQPVLYGGNQPDVTTMLPDYPPSQVFYEATAAGAPGAYYSIPLHGGPQFLVRPPLPPTLEHPSTLPQHTAKQSGSKPVHHSLMKPEHRNSRANRRGPMDEMRQLVRILVKLMPNSMKYLAVSDEGGGGNRVSEEQIREYLKNTLGKESPSPEWGLPKGWGHYLAEMFSWATDRTVSQEDAMLCARRLPGRSWEAVTEELERLELYTWGWPLPLNKEGIQVAQASAPPAPTTAQLHQYAAAAQAAAAAAMAAGAAGAAAAQHPDGMLASAPPAGETEVKPELASVGMAPGTSPIAGVVQHQFAVPPAIKVKRPPEENVEKAGKRRKSKQAGQPGNAHSVAVASIPELPEFDCWYYASLYLEEAFRKADSTPEHMMRDFAFLKGSVRRMVCGNCSGAPASHAAAGASAANEGSEAARPSVVVKPEAVPASAAGAPASGPPVVPGGSYIVRSPPYHIMHQGFMVSAHEHAAIAAASQHIHSAQVAAAAAVAAGSVAMPVASHHPHPAAAMPTYPPGAGATIVAHTSTAPAAAELPANAAGGPSADILPGPKPLRPQATRPQASPAPGDQSSLFMRDASAPSAHHNIRMGQEGTGFMPYSAQGPKQPGASTSGAAPNSPGGSVGNPNKEDTHVVQPKPEPKVEAAGSQDPPSGSGSGESDETNNTPHGVQEGRAPGADADSKHVLGGEEGSRPSVKGEEAGPSATPQPAAPASGPGAHTKCSQELRNNVFKQMDSNAEAAVSQDRVLQGQGYGPASVHPGAAHAMHYQPTMLAAHGQHYMGHVMAPLPHHPYVAHHYHYPQAQGMQQPVFLVPGHPDLLSYPQVQPVGLAMPSGVSAMYSGGYYGAAPVAGPSSVPGAELVQDVGLDATSQAAVQAAAQEAHAQAHAAAAVAAEAARQGHATPADSQKWSASFSAAVKP